MSLAGVAALWKYDECWWSASGIALIRGRLRHRLVGLHAKPFWTWWWVLLPAMPVLLVAGILLQSPLLISFVATYGMLGCTAEWHRFRRRRMALTIEAQIRSLEEVLENLRVAQIQSFGAYL